MVIYIIYDVYVQKNNIVTYDIWYIWSIIPSGKLT